jgi:beta-phosphoglucomutase-like phosphatase (HAD superfamily)
VFLHTAGVLGFAPEDCLVVEDAEKGVLAAHRAGMRCVAVPNPYTRGGDFSLATVVLDSIAELTPKRVHDLLPA